MLDLKHCNKCGYRHGEGRCCIDIYQQLGHAKGPSVAGKVVLAFLLPVLIFIGSMILADAFLSSHLAEGGTKTVIAFLAAFVTTLVFIQLIRVFTRKPIFPENNKNRNL